MTTPSYFVEHRRGEVAELQSMLRNPKLDAVKKRGVVERVIAYMTLGIDVSNLFTDMIMATYTKDLVQKKMVYLYIATFAVQKPETALLAINTLQKDCRDDDPMVRGLALRSLCSLRVPQLLEYVMLPIRKGLNDPSPYVRKAAVVGCAKIHTLASAMIKDSDIVDLLYNMLKDRDPVVVDNVIQALNDILADEGGIVTNRQIIMHLLNRLRDFNEWAQCTILELLARYRPESEQELYDIMNLLEDRLRHANSAVVMGTVKVFLFFTQSYPQVHRGVYDRVKAPLLTFIGGTSHHVAYPILTHVKLLVARCPGAFDDQFKAFYLRHNDPLCIKAAKLEILAKLANPANGAEILNEISEYVADASVQIGKKSIRTIGYLAITVEEVADEAIEHLLSFLDLHMDHVNTETCVVLKDLLRKYPERHEEILPALQRAVRSVRDEDGKVAVIWILGEYGDKVPEAPYILEDYIDEFDTEPSCMVRCELLSAAVKLFFKRPPEVHKMLGRLLKSAISDTEQEVLVRDRALLYYGLLRQDCRNADRVINCSQTCVDTFAEIVDTDVIDVLFLEFNSLAVVFEKSVNSLHPGAAASAAAVTSKNEGESQNPHSDHSSPLQHPVEDLLSLNANSFDLPSAQTSLKSELSESPVCDAPTFQNEWGSLRNVDVIQLVLSPKQDPNRIEQTMANGRITPIASGTLNQNLKMYYYTQKASNGALAFVEILVALPTRELNATFRSRDESFAKQVSIYVQDLLQQT